MRYRVQENKKVKCSAPLAGSRPSWFTSVQMNFNRTLLALKDVLVCKVKYKVTNVSQSKAGQSRLLSGRVSPRRKEEEMMCYFRRKVSSFLVQSGYLKQNKCWVCVLCKIKILFKKERHTVGTQWFDCK